MDERQFLERAIAAPLRSTFYLCMRPAERARRSIEVTGVVQGVGFRPFVHGVASRLGLGGCVRNRAGTVHIEVEGAREALDRFLDELRSKPPSLARIDDLRVGEEPPRGESEFRIEDSDDGAGEAMIPADAATCEDCLRELQDPADRRHAYPFINCTNCGPRLTIIVGAPYDRERTTMARFEMCAQCRAEYEDPSNRRFHAEPVCCPACGPSLRIAGVSTAEDPIAFTARELRRGRIAAIKGIGGYHLACDARSDEAVGELRRRKARDAKPFALMVRDPAQAEALCRISAEERALLASPARPIVLLARKPGTGVAAGVAPGGNPSLGLMLPYTPLHHLLLRSFDGPLVMTSGNRSDEPIAYEDDDALARLSGIADFFLLHDRPIHTRCDDSVVRVLDGAPLPLRRARGFAPLPIALPLDLAQPTLAVGGQLKSTFALGAARRAFLSHHLGDLDHWPALRAFLDSIPRYQQLCRIQPARAVHDLHPDYASTRWAETAGLPRLGVQHHHAHFASCLAENGERGKAIGVCFDGTGYGLDGTIWGGEFLVGDARAVTRAAHLFAVPMPGGEAAIREPWRMAASHLRAAGEPHRPVPLSGPLTSSMGRLFDAVAAIAGAHAGRVDYEAQAAIALEWRATGVDADEAYPAEVFESGGALVLDPRPLIRAVSHAVRAGRQPHEIARRFHSAVIAWVVRTCRLLRERTGIITVALSGGVFMNAILAQECAARLSGEGFRVLRHRLVPPNDGGLSLGQLAAAAARDAGGE
jgi:hydrogenase maturation protein HypF